jgi:CDP-diacylglycerol--glycerol-3-phosphate 3-phosphatidyltransferase
MDFRKNLGNQISGIIIPAISKTKISPNALTVTGLVIILAASVLVAFDYLLAGGILVLVAGLFDILDGALARYANKTTKFGAVLDSTFDRFSEGALFAGLLILYVPKGQILIPALIVASLIFSFLISYIRARAEGIGVSCQVGFFTRTERVIIMALALILGGTISDIIILIALIILALFSLITVIQRLVHVYGQTRNNS